MDESFRKLLAEKKAEYKSQHPVYCSAIKEFVHFKMHGFMHFRFQSDFTPRTPKEIKRRFDLIPLIRPLLQDAQTALHKPHSVTIRGVSRETHYWIIESATIKEKATIRIILRKRAGAQHVEFLSIYQVKQKRKNSHR